MPQHAARSRGQRPALRAARRLGNVAWLCSPAVEFLAVQLCSRAPTRRKVTMMRADSSSRENSMSTCRQGGREAEPWCVPAVATALPSYHVGPSRPLNLEKEGNHPSRWQQSGSAMQYTCAVPGSTLRWYCAIQRPNSRSMRAELKVSVSGFCRMAASPSSPPAAATSALLKLSEGRRRPAGAAGGGGQWAVVHSVCVCARWSLVPGKRLPAGWCALVCTVRPSSGRS